MHGQQRTRVHLRLPGRMPRTEFKLTALPQVSGALSRNLSGQDVALIVVLVLVLVAEVVLTAIWAGSDRRKATFDVLDRLLPWRM